MKRIVAWGAYPFAMSGALILYALLLAAGVSPLAAAYVPVFLVAVSVAQLEQRFPLARAWNPAAAEWRTDAAFMLLVQIGLPRLLTAALALYGAAWAHAQVPAAWWPHHWTLAAQTLLMLLAVDFLRYWLHRACHALPVLWRLHEVHHAPEKLYALNVARFHPLEKALHFACDTLPFVMLGVAPEVIAAYFVVYSVGGLFQHCNLRLRFGWMNHVIASAQAHRWHHARDPRVAACNYGNTFVLWDRLFGTFHLPAGRGARELGVPDRVYPRGFFPLLAAPFRGLGWLARGVDALAAAGLTLTRVLAARRLREQLRDPMRAQRAVLARLLAENRNTAFGREHGFAGIATPEDFAVAVPVRDAEAMRPWIERAKHFGAGVLTREAPIAYLRTSGTTGLPNDIPLTRSHAHALRRVHSESVAFQHRLTPRGFHGAALAIVSPMEEGLLAGGLTYGAASGLVMRNTPALLRAKLVAPAEVMALRDYRLKYLLILRLALARRDLAYIGTANPGTLLALRALFREHAWQLVRDVRHGGFHLAEELPAALRTALAPRLAADPARADELGALLARPRPLRIADLWPALRLVVCWTCGSAGVAAAALRRELDAHTRIAELGYVASEFRATVTLGRRAGSGLPTLDTHFFEFAECARWDRGERVFLTLDRLRKGVDYYPIVSTPGGLYRYFINDVVRVRGFLHATPLIQFVQKGRGVTNICGEKVAEKQILSSTLPALAEACAAPRLVCAVADEAACRYRVLIEADAPFDCALLARRIDARLAELNCEYRARRASARLAAPEVIALAAGAGEAFKRHGVARGQREGQFKPRALLLARELDFDFTPFTLSRVYPANMEVAS